MAVDPFDGAVSQVDRRRVKPRPDYAALAKELESPRRRNLTPAEHATEIEQHARVLGKVLKMQLSESHRQRIEQQLARAYEAIRPRTWRTKVLQSSILSAFEQAAATVRRLGAEHEPEAVRWLATTVDGVLNDKQAPLLLWGSKVDRSMVKKALAPWCRRPGNPGKAGHKTKYESAHDFFVAIGVTSQSAGALKKMWERSDRRRREAAIREARGL